MANNRECFENHTQQTMVLWLEPWGGGYELKPGSKLLLLYDLAKEPTTDTLDVDVASRGEELWIPFGSTPRITPTFWWMMNRRSAIAKVSSRSSLGQSGRRANVRNGS